MVHYESIRTHLEIAIWVTGKNDWSFILYVCDKNKILFKMSITCWHGDDPFVHIIYMWHCGERESKTHYSHTEMHECMEASWLSWVWTYQALPGYSTSWNHWPGRGQEPLPGMETWTFFHTLFFIFHTFQDLEKYKIKFHTFPYFPYLRRNPGL